MSRLPRPQCPEADRARTFDSTDGVSCESCHGPASNWLGPHTTKGWTHERSVAAGMRDLRDPVHRAENCLTCHLGTSDKGVDHEMIAAGHPDLYFESASFTAAMPRHWNEHAADDRTKDDPFADVRMLAAGQAVQLREQLQRVARNAQASAWPEFADLDCFACHHSLTSAENSWRQEQGYAGRKAGSPAWNLSRYAVLRQIVNEMDREAGRRLETEVDKLYSIMSAGNPDRNRPLQARTTADVAGRIALQMSSASFDQALPSAFCRPLRVTATLFPVRVSARRSKPPWRFSRCTLRMLRRRIPVAILKSALRSRRCFSKSKIRRLTMLLSSPNRCVHSARCFREAGISGGAVGGRSTRPRADCR